MLALKLGLRSLATRAAYVAIHVWQEITNNWENETRNWEDII